MDDKRFASIGDPVPALNVPTDEEIALAEALRRELERRLLPQPSPTGPGATFGAQHYAWAERYRRG
jgi:hypothetical protein